MTKEEAKALWVDHTEGTLSADQEKLLSEYLEVNPELKAEFKELELIWSKLDNVSTPLPSPQMDEKFHSMLTGFEVGSTQGQPNLIRQLSEVWNSFLSSRIGVAVTMLIIGGFIGYFLSGNNSTTNQLATLNTEVNEMKKMMMLTLIEQPKALDRMKAVQISNEIGAPDNKVIDALLSTLNNDPNVNVRLVAAQSLAAMAADPIVRKGLIASISSQTSPVIQNALADIMLDLMDKAAVQPLEELLEQPNLDTLVKEKIQTTIETLI